MPRLILFRHAKAKSSGKDGPADHERELTARGLRQAGEMGRVLAERGEAADLVLCSTSQRTRQTWTEASKALSGFPEPRFLRGIYDAGSSYFELLRREGGTARSLVLVGHNPAIQQTARQLPSGPDSPEAAKLSADFPTSALAVFDIDGSWADLAPGLARLVAFVAPAEPPEN